jgi:NAD(P)-dependent dehydrogenase (short-subunit alcohol dehydrogenase family)
MSTRKIEGKLAKLDRVKGTHTASVNFTSWSRAQLIRLITTRPDVKVAVAAYFAKRSMPGYSTRIKTERLLSALIAIGVVEGLSQSGKSCHPTKDVFSRFDETASAQERNAERKHFFTGSPVWRKHFFTGSPVCADYRKEKNTTKMSRGGEQSVNVSVKRKGVEEEEEEDVENENKVGVEDERKRVVVITGAARGIGRATAVAFARTNAHVVGIDVCAIVCGECGVEPASRDDLHETGRLVEEAGGQWSGFVADQRRIGELRIVAEKILRTLGGADVLFANAGVQGFVSLLDMHDDDDMWQTTLDVNLTGTANALRAFAPHMVARKKGRVIVTTSTQGRHGTLGGAAYSASKWGIIGLMKSAALEFGPHGITVNAVVPGLCDTLLTRHEERYAQIIRDAGGTPSGNVKRDEAEARKLMIRKTPLKVPWLQPEDVANIVVFLASESARMVSGATYDVTGGDSAHYS